MPSHIKESQIQNRSSSQSYGRGKKMYQQGAVFGMTRRGNDITGRCEGSSPEAYHVRATLDNKDNIAHTSCDCEYSYEGDCKHIVALLLTYANKPQAFVELPPTQDLLAERSKEELILLIQQMVARYPELQSMVDRPMPSQQTANSDIDLAPFRSELQDALGTFTEWGDTTASDTVQSIAEAAQAFANAGQWHNASAIYQVVLEECINSDYPDDEGYLIGAIDEIIEEAMECLGQLKIANDDIERPKLVRQLLEVHFWDIKLGGVDIGGQYLPDGLFAYIATQDVPPIRQRVEAIQQQYQRQSIFGSWGVSNLEKILIKLDQIEGISEEASLKRLRSQGHFMLLFEKLMELKREDEAIQVAEKHLSQPPHLLEVLPILLGKGRLAEGRQLAKQALNKQFDGNTARWLAEFYHKQQDRQGFFELQLQWMKHQPSPQVFSTLKAAAEKIGIWENVRDDVITQVKRSKNIGLLIQVLLIEQEWDVAWNELEKIPEREQGMYIVGAHPSKLDLFVAELSAQARPHKAIPVYLKYVRRMVDERKRSGYQVAAAYLAIVRHLYTQMDETEAWNQLIDGYRSEFRMLRAFQDELNQANL